MTSLRGGCQQSFNGMLVRPRIHHMFVLRGDDTVALTGFILEDGTVGDLDSSSRLNDCTGLLQN